LKFELRKIASGLRNSKVLRAPPPTQELTPESHLLWGHHHTGIPPSALTLFDFLKAKEMLFNLTKTGFPIILQLQNPDTYCCQNNRIKIILRGKRSNAKYLA